MKKKKNYENIPQVELFIFSLGFKKKQLQNFRSECEYQWGFYLNT